VTVAITHPEATTTTTPVERFEAQLVTGASQIAGAVCEFLLLVGSFRFPPEQAIRVLQAIEIAPGIMPELPAEVDSG
jgi:hypothetical protein